MKNASAMKAVVHDRYGPPEVLRVENVDPPQPKDDEVLVRVRASTVTRSDAHERSGKPFVSRLIGGSLVRPRRKVLGTDFAGEVVAAGPDATDFALGERVFGAIPMLAARVGSHAEFVSLPKRFPIAPMPAGRSFEEVAPITDAMLALEAMRPAEIRDGTEILIYGASGALGTAGVQLARHFGARVTAVCNTKNVELVRSLGAAEVIDYTQDDFTKNGKTYDVLFDAVGKHSFRRSRGSLKPGGVYLPTDGFVNLFWWLWTRRLGDRQVRFKLPPRLRQEDLLFLKRLIEAREYRAVIDRTYPVEEVVEATRYVETQQKTGNVVLTFG